MCNPGDPCAGSSTTTTAATPASGPLFDLSTLSVGAGDWTATPGQRTGLAGMALELDTNHAEAQLEGRASVIRANDPVPYVLNALGLGQDAAAPAQTTAATADPSSAGTVAPELGWKALAAFGLGALIIIAAGAFAVARGD